MLSEDKPTAEVGHDVGTRQAIADAVRARMRARGLNQATLADRTKVSERTIRAVLKAQPLSRVDKRAAIALGLGWTADSLDRIERGEPPLDEVPTVPLVERVARVERDLGALTDQVRALAQTLSDVLGQRADQ